MKRQMIIDALRGTEPPLEITDVLEEFGLGKFYGGMNDEFEWEEEFPREIPTKVLEKLYDICKADEEDWEDEETDE